MVVMMIVGAVRRSAAAEVDVVACVTVGEGTGTVVGQTW